MLQWLFRRFDAAIKNLTEKRVVKQYLRTGMDFADADSYVPMMGKCIGYDRLERKWARLEKKYAEFGYRTVTAKDFDEALHGASIDHLVRVPRGENELPVLYGSM